MIVCRSQWAGIKFSTFVDGRGILQPNPPVRRRPDQVRRPPVRPSLSGGKAAAELVQSSGVEWCFGQMCAICPEMFLNRALAVDEMTCAEPNFRLLPIFLSPLKAREDQRC
jgi:hypothetical protein